jgi:hypothetical protein
MRQFSISLVLLILFTSFPAAAEAIGHYTTTAASAPATATPNTVIDLTAPMDEQGTIGTIAIRSNGFACENGFKVKFFRRNGNSLTSIAERGPFSPAGGLTTVDLVPAVALEKNDLIGIVSLQSCMVASGQTPVVSAEAIQFPGDITSGNLTTGTRLPYFALAAYGARDFHAEVRTQVIIVAGAAAGAGGSQFRTDVFLTAPRQNFSSGHFVYHREATVGVNDDPSVKFDLEPGGSKTIPNIIGTSLGLSGKGSVDVYTQIGFEPPIVAARVYDDGGAAGTKGFAFDAQKLSEAVQPGQQGVLFTPQDKARFRMNVGIRTLDVATQIDFIVLTSTGAVRGVVTHSYPANYYIQPDLNGLLNGMATQPGDTILVSPVEAAAFVYGSIIDNATNDPSLQLAKPLQ